MTELHERDSAVDLVLRGFSRDEIRARIGVDVGYNGLAVIRPGRTSMWTEWPTARSTCALDTASTGSGPRWIELWSTTRTCLVCSPSWASGQGLARRR